MRRIMFIFISVFCLAGCGKDIYTDIDAAMKENGKFFSESFVTAYYDLEDIRIEDHDDFLIPVSYVLGKRYSKDSDNPEDAARYEELKTKYSDISFNGYIDPCQGYPEALSSDLQSIEVFALNDWDMTHPSGSSLNDVICVNIRSLYVYIAGGYKDYYSGLYDGVLSGLTPEMMKCLPVYSKIYLYLGADVPHNGKELLMRVKTTDGKVFDKGIKL